MFIIQNFASSFECDRIKALAEPSLSDSGVGDSEYGHGQNQNLRNSRTAWVPRESEPLTESLYRRAADMLQIPENRLRREDLAEHLQVVRYHKDERYDWHHDWSDSFPGSRFVTAIMYLNDVEEGAEGETAFRGFKVRPSKGSVLLFYNLLPDGNGDEKTWHSALPLLKGEKWIANLWVWDPKFFF